MAYKIDYDKEIRYILEYDLDENGKPIFGRWIKENQYIRKKKLKKLKKLTKKNE